MLNDHGDCVETYISTRSTGHSCSNLHKSRRGWF